MNISVWIHSCKAYWRDLLIGLANLVRGRPYAGLDRMIHPHFHFHLVDALRYFTRTQVGFSFEFFSFFLAFLAFSASFWFEFWALWGIADPDKGSGNLSLEPKDCRCGDVDMYTFAAGHQLENHKLCHKDHWRTNSYLPLENQNQNHNDPYEGVTHWHQISKVLQCILVCQNLQIFILHVTPTHQPTGNAEEN